jgi:hypothetical protein
MILFNRPISVIEYKKNPTVSVLNQAQRQQDFVTTRLEVSFRRAVARAINKHVKLISSKIAIFGANTYIGDDIDALGVDLTKLFTKQHERTGNVFATEFYAGLENLSPGLIDAAASRDIFNASLERFVNSTGVSHAQMSTATTGRQVRAVISSSIEGGLSNEAMAKAVQMNVGGMASAQRADLIARTETHTAAQFSQNEAANSTGLTFRKYWVDVTDERTREDHVAAGAFSRANIILNDKPFSVGGIAMMYPGDPDGTAEQIINCRCAAVRRVII